jgi:hypothetical protein
MDPSSGRTWDIQLPYICLQKFLMHGVIWALPVARIGTFIYLLGWEFGLVFRAAGWHAGDPGLILCRDGLYTFECMALSAVSILGIDLCAIKRFLFHFIFSSICLQSQLLPFDFKSQLLLHFEVPQNLSI